MIKVIFKKYNLVKIFPAFFLLIWLVKVPARVYSLSGTPETIIKVGILSGKKRVHIKSYGKLEVVNINTLDFVRLKAGTDYMVEAAAEGIKVGDKILGNEVRFVSLSRKEMLTVNGQRFRDTIMIKKTKEGLTAINELGLDGYLFGVLPVEVSPAWPIESLKAQAVVSRTYVMNNLGKYKSKGYDLSSDIFSQMYKGVEVENPKSNRAVSETAGRVLTYNGNLARAYFYSSCGGYTAEIKEVWGNDILYMRGVTCPYCKDSPRYRWEKKISPSLIKEKLNKKGYNVGEVEDIKFLSRTASGRIKEMEIIHSAGKISLRGHKFRMAVGPNIVMSTMMSIDRSKENFLFYGRGWGHGAGMCQWGAKGQAERGRSYKDILEFYFPGTKVKKWAY